MGILENYTLSLEQLKQTKIFMQDLNPIDFDLRSLVHTIDAKINKTEQMIFSLQTTKTFKYRCSFCDYGYDEEYPRSVGDINVCPKCRELGSKYKMGSDLEKIHNLPAGTIKRDCLPLGGNSPKLQPFMDCGLVFKSGIHNIVHEIVIDMYYKDPDKYVRRKLKDV